MVKMDMEMEIDIDRDIAAGIFVPITFTRSSSVMY